MQVLYSDTNKLFGKTFYFLGSSVTFGVGDEGVSFVEFIRERNGCKCIKEAVCGTTLADVDDGSYVHRFMNNCDPDLKPDHFICQLSTNDSGRDNVLLGEISDSFDPDDFDTTTTIGAMEFIIYKAMEIWQCPVSFYTGTKFESPRYSAMVEALFKLQKKWSIGIIDLWNQSGLCTEVDAVMKKYMNDFVHPNERGYEEWWTPIFESHLAKYE